MRCRKDVLRKARKEKGYTQDKLALMSRLSPRTVQRAEQGADLGPESIADLAAALELPVKVLAMAEAAGSERSDAGEPDREFGGKFVVLRRAMSGRDILDVIEKSKLARLDCDIEPTDDNIAALRDIIGSIEALLPDPWSWEQQVLAWSSLVDRLDAAYAFGRRLETLRAAGIGVFVGYYHENVIYPQKSEHGEVYTSTDQRSELVRAARLLVSASEPDKITAEIDYNWPVRVVGFDYDDLDDDVPF